MRIVCCLLALLSVASGEEYLDRFRPQTPAPLARPKPAEPEPRHIALPKATGHERLKLRGLAFVSNLAQMDGAGATRGIATADVPLLAHPAFEKRMKEFLGQPITMDLVDAIASATTEYYRGHDRPVVRVVAPEQDVTEGVLRLLVTEGRLGEVRVAGNRWFHSDLFRVRIRPLEPIPISELERDAAFYGRNPFRSVTTELAPGGTDGKTDVTLRVEDRFPLRVYAGYDNSGVKSTDENRLFTGFNYGNLFGLGQQLSYQFSTNVEFDGLFAHSGVWSIPLPWLHTLEFSGTYAESQPRVDNGFDLRGQTWQVGAHYVIPLPTLHHYTQELTLGYDYKSTNNNLQFGGEQVFETPVELNEFNLGYNASLPDKWGRTSLSAAATWSPGGMSGHNTNADLDAARAGSKANYFYATAGLDRVTKLPWGLSWALTLKGQLASGNLQSIDQFFLGGEGSVRGYDELAVAGDDGLLVRNEIYSPSVSLGHLFHASRLHDELQFLAFHDYGLAGVRHPLPDEDRTTQLESLGVGVRWQIERYLSAYCDYGWQLMDIHQADHDRSRVSVGATISY